MIRAAPSGRHGDARPATAAGGSNNGDCPAIHSHLWHGSAAPSSCWRGRAKGTGVLALGSSSHTHGQYFQLQLARQGLSFLLKEVKVTETKIFREIGPPTQCLNRYGASERAMIGRCIRWDIGVGKPESVDQSASPHASASSTPPSASADVSLI
ncbi:uncharacterized protein BO80DRAFT_434936 [Aspergillus ibericus CBS 121593]|uniref:Uncharacterized protein n=1 Tax=Aspergillus ibericus CBS 121593 TaxID=1448316 RepID=A0A395H3P9_9EURO|nr:hypothetical protein BO80DRAFT_434936 [Aspergillus ibericus CBS 121593]RAL00854.1 hypothetical protein BO80DRAFT_434936 [Aspergillus ibericus CBS 121593]